MVSHDTASHSATAPMLLDDRQLALVAGGLCTTAWCGIGHAVADAYQWAVAKTTDFFEWALG